MIDIISVHLRIAFSRYAGEFSCNGTVENRLRTIETCLHEKPHEWRKRQADESVVTERHVTVNVSTNYTGVGRVYCYTGVCNNNKYYYNYFYYYNYYNSYYYYYYYNYSVLTERHVMMNISTNYTGVGRVY